MNDFEKGMRATCKLAARTLRLVGGAIRPGVSTNELNAIAHEFILSNGATPSPLGYEGFPKSICTSVNGVLCHGIPNDMPLREGDIVNVDVTTCLKGYHGDTSATFPVGAISDQAQKVIDVAKKSMLAGISAVIPSRRSGDIGYTSSLCALSHGMQTAPDIGGHGIGRSFHMDPFIPGHAAFGTGALLKAGMCITVEPIIIGASVTIVIEQIPGSSIPLYKTADGSLAAQFEHTILITKRGHEILTLGDL